MKKVLVVFDGSNFSEGAFQFVNRLNKLQPLLVVGAFLPEIDYANMWSYAAAAGAGTGAVYLPFEEDETETVEESISHFKSLCQEHGIQYRIHKDFPAISLSELKQESRFADIMIISGELFYKGITLGNQFESLKNVLHLAECPVIIVPENYIFPTNNILAYDAGEDSVYAIKQFAYIFPELARNKTLLVFADEEEEKTIPAKDRIRELIVQHYTDLDIYKLEINPRKFFADWMIEKKAAILISGSFSRSGLSQMFKKSFVADIIRDHQMPVFIAHR